jgi:hypothetical protein
VMSLGANKVAAPLSSSEVAPCDGCHESTGHDSLASSPGVALSLDVPTGCQYHPIGLVTPPRTWRWCRSVERRRCASRYSRASRATCTFRSPSSPSAELRLLQSLTVVGGRSGVAVAFRAAPLMRFSAPSALPNCRVHLPGVYRPPYVPSPGFLTLSTAYSSTVCPALFHARALMEFLTLQSFSLARSRGASRRLMPSCHSSRTPVVDQRDPQACRPVEGLPIVVGPVGRGFKALLPGSSPLRHRPPLGGQRARCSPGFRAPSGLSLVDLAPQCFHAAPPASFRSASLGTR